MKKSQFVGITIPKELYENIEKDRGDLPRSYVYKKLVGIGYHNSTISHLVLESKHENK